MNVGLTWSARRYFATGVSLRDKAFLDSLELIVQGGFGGRGNPNLGGRGGDGGSVYFRGKRSLKLHHLRKRFPELTVRAGDGKNAEPVRLLGAPGNDVIVTIPTGVTVTNRRGVVVADIDSTEERVLVAPGAAGNHAAKVRKTVHRFLRLDLKLVADVGLVGFPNAGKSTLLTRLSNARPKIANYPFTTLQPQLGVVDIDGDRRRVTVADLPGLIEGAHANVGLGHTFLKHVERTKALVFVVDINGFCLKDTPRTPFETVALLTRELELYDVALTTRPAVLCLNKVDDDDHLPRAMDVVTKLNAFDESLADSSLTPETTPRTRMRFREVHAISAKEGVNIKSLVKSLDALIHGEKEEEKDRSRRLFS